MLGESIISITTILVHKRTGFSKDGRAEQQSALVPVRHFYKRLTQLQYTPLYIQTTKNP